MSKSLLAATLLLVASGNCGDYEHSGQRQSFGKEKGELYSLWPWFMVRLRLYVK